MKVKTSITLSDNILQEIDNRLLNPRLRSSFIEQAIIYYLTSLKKKQRDEHDLAIINALSESLNQEAEDVLSFQADM